MPEALSPGVYVEEISFRSHPIEGVSTSTTGFIGMAEQGPFRQPVLVTSFADFQRMFGGLQEKAELGYAVRLYFDNGGQKAWIVRVGGQTQIPAVVSAFDALDAIGLLCIPGCVDAPTLQAAVAYCDRRRTFLVIDPPSSDARATQDLAATLRATGSKNAAVYFPAVTVADPLAGGAPRQTVPSGAAAGVIARIDAARGVWVAPAGVGAQLIGVLGVLANIDQATAQSLADAGINSIRSVPGQDLVLWTAQTVSGGDQWKYIAVRRLALFIERSLTRGLQWAVFEPNGERLWIQLSVVVTAFMSALWEQGAFQGATAPDAFFVKYGREVMTQADIDVGRLILLVGFAPLTPAEFVIVQITVLLGHRP